MQDKNQDPNAVFPDEGIVQPPPMVVFGNGQSISPGALSYEGPVVSEDLRPVVPKQPNIFVRVLKRADVILALLLVFGMVGMFIVTSTKGTDKQGNSSNSVGVSNQYGTQEIPLEGLGSGSNDSPFGSSSVAINGSTQLNGGLVITPSLQPSAPKTGQLYYDQATNVMAYYDGTDFVTLGSGGTTVEGVGGLTGQVGLGGGLAVVGNQLINAGVLSVGGQSGAIVLGSGLTMAGNTLQNTGILNVVAGSGIAVNTGSNGSVTISNTGAGSGTVASSGGTVGRIPVFTGAQNIEDSLISQSGLTTTINGDLNVVTGGLSLTNALTVANGGTGSTSLATNGVLVGNGTGAISSVTAAGTGLCLVSTAGAPIFTACPSSSGVTTLNSLSGAVTIADSNADILTGTITIEDASTTNKGIAQFNSSNFTDNGSGTINTIQNIGTGATPTFAGINTNTITPSSTLTAGSTAQTLVLQGNSSTVITATSGANTTTVGFNAPSANVSIKFPALSAGSYDLCTTSGNCLGGGGGGANTALSNLASVAINTTLLPGSAGGVNLGSGTLPFGDIYLAGTSVTPGTNNFLITGASTGGTRTITLPDASGTVCLSTGNCAGAGSGVTVSSSGTIGTLPVFSGTQTIADSLVSQSGGTVTVAGNLNLTTSNQFQINGTQISSADLSNDANLAKLNGSQTFTGNANSFRNGSNSSNAFNIQNASGTRVLTINTTAGQIQLGTASTLDGGLVFYNGSNANAVTIVPGTPTGNRTITLPDSSGIVCLDTGNCAGAGSTLQTAYNFSPGGTTPKIKVDSTLQTVDIQDADVSINGTLLAVRESNGSGLGQIMLGVSSTGELTLQNGTNSTTALRLLTDGGTAVLTGDTQNGRIILGQGGTLAGQLQLSNATNSNLGTLQTAVLGQSTVYTFPDPASGTATICLQNSSSCGFASSGGSGNYIQNQIASPQNADFYISGSGRAATLNGTTGINTGATAGTQRIDSSGNLLNIGNITGTGAITIASAGAGNDITINGADQFIVQDNSVFNAGADIVSNDSAVNSPAFRVLQQGSGDATIQFNTSSTSNSFYVGQDASNSGSFVINSSSAASSVYGPVTRTGSLGRIDSNVNSSSQSITVPADAEIIVVGVASEGSPESGYFANGSVTINGQALTFATAYEGASSTMSNAIFYRVSPATGSRTLAWDWGGTSAGNHTSLYYAFYKGIDTSSPVIAGSSDGNNSPSSTLGTLLNGRNGDAYVAVAYGSGSSAIGVGLSWTGMTGLGSTGSTTWSSAFAEAFPSSPTTVTVTLTNATAAQKTSISGISLRGASTSGVATNTFDSAAFTITQNGAATFRNAVESTTGFQVLNAHNVPLFVADTSNSYVYIGNPTADMVGALLVLDTKNTSANPTGVNGGMYYNSNAGLFRCYQASEWRDCVSSVKSTSTANSYTGTGSNSGALTEGDVPSATISFTKSAGSTKLAFTMHVVVRALTANAPIALGLRVNGATTQCANFTITTANVYMPISCSGVISSVPAGSYTGTMRWTGFTNASLQVDANQYSILIQETD